MLILSHIEQHNGQNLEIFVKYSSDENLVLEIKSVFIGSPLGMIPVGNLMINLPELEVAINKIIDRVDWREKARELKEAA